MFEWLIGIEQQESSIHSMNRKRSTGMPVSTDSPMRDAIICLRFSRVSTLPSLGEPIEE